MTMTATTAMMAQTMMTTTRSLVAAAAQTQLTMEADRALKAGMVENPTTMVTGATSPATLILLVIFTPTMEEARPGEEAWRHLLTAAVVPSALLKQTLVPPPLKAHHNHCNVPPYYLSRSP